MHRSALLTPLAVGIGTALVLTTQTSVAPAQSAAPHPKAAKTSPTPYLLSTVGWASRAIGGKLPVSSGHTAFSVVACNNRAGVDRSNAKADVKAPGGIALSNVKTRTWTSKTGTTVSSYSRQYIERVTLADTPLGSLYIEAVVSKSRAWHNGTGFHSTARADLADIVFDSILAPPKHLALPLPGKSVRVPGVATISLGVGTETSNARGARAAMDAVKVRVIPTDTTVYLGHSAASVKAGTPSAFYRGYSFGLKADVAEGVVTSDRTPNMPTPCIGSHGKTLSRDVATVTPLAGVRASILRATTQSGKDAQQRNFVTNTAKVARVALGNGLKVKAIQARAHVHKTGKHYVKNSHGTTLGAITLNGQTLRLPKTGVLNIPGVARLETNIVKRTRKGISVTALRVTLLDGRLATIDIGQARVGLSPTHA